MATMHTGWSLRRAAAYLLAVGIAMLAATCSAPAASSDVVVAMQVPSATTLTPGSCVPGSAGVTAFGIVHPSTSRVGDLCTVTFGSTNGTARLRLAQTDGGGDAMWTFGDGSVDPDFGSGTGFFSIETGGTDYAEQLVRQSTGRSILLGRSVYGDSEMTLTGVTPEGTLDTTFGTTVPGMTRIDVNPTGAEDIYDGALLPDDSILIAAAAGNVGNEDSVIAKFDEDGALDTSFGTGGIWTMSLDAGTDLAKSVDPLPDGRLVVSGQAGSDVYALRLTADGQLDTTYGTAGITRIDLGSTESSSDTTVGPDGTLYLAASRGTSTALLRVDEHGTFLGATVTSIGAGNSYLYDVIIGQDGAIYGAALGNQGGGRGNDFALMRFSTAGVLDTSWAASGVSFLSISPGAGSDVPLHLLQLPDSRLLLVGRGNDGSNRWAAALMHVDGQPDTSFGDGGAVMWTHTTGTADAVLLAEDGHVQLGGSGFGGVMVGQLDAHSIPDYEHDGGGDDTSWSNGANTFGACLESLVGAGSAATWSMTGSCTATDADPWQPVARRSSDGTAEVARTTSSGATATASLRFGMRTAANQRPGAYVAPVTMTVVAP